MMRTPSTPHTSEAKEARRDTVGSDSSLYALSLRRAVGRVPVRRFLRQVCWAPLPSGIHLTISPWRLRFHKVGAVHPVALAQLCAPCGPWRTRRAL